MFDRVGIFLFVLFSAAQTLHHPHDAEDLLPYLILQVLIPQFLITDEYMVTTASKFLLIGLVRLS